MLPNGSPIMPSHSNEVLKNYLDKDEYVNFIKKFGNKTIFDYGCETGQYKIFVYRITLTTEGGQSIDYSWKQLKRRCEKMGVNHVPEIAQYYFSEYMQNFDKNYDLNFQDEKFWIDITEQDCKYFPFHLNEGIVVRIENGNLCPQFYKSKRYTFKVLEGIIKDKQDFADLEESN